MQGDASEPSLSSSDAETPKAAAGRGSPELRRRSLLPWRRSEEQAQLGVGFDALNSPLESLKSPRNAMRFKLCSCTIIIYHLPLHVLRLLLKAF